MLWAYVFFSELFILFLLSRETSKELSVLFYRVTHNNQITIYLLALLFLPGTFIHELAHFFMAKVLFVPAGHLELWPKREGNWVKLGSVLVGKTDPVRNLLIGVAPFLAGIGIVLGSLYFATTAGLLSNYWIDIALGYVLFEVGNTMFSSKKDMEGTVILLLVVGLLVISFYVLGFHEIVDGVLQLFLQANSFFLFASKLVAIPVGIDILSIVVLKFLTS